MPKLFVLSGKELGASFEVGDGAVIGRAPESTVRLSDSSISRQHARIERDGPRWHLLDLDSRNGIRHGGQRVEHVVLVDHDEVLIGDVQVRFREESAPAPPARAERAAGADKAPRRPAASRVAPGSADAGEPELEEDIDLEALAATAAFVPKVPPVGTADARRAQLVRSTSARGGLLTDALEDRPFWLSTLLFLVVLALSGGLAYGIFRLVVGARGG